MTLALVTAPPSSAPRGWVGRAVRWLDEKSTGQADTQGDFDKPAYSQALLNGTIEGFALGGFGGALVACGASAAGVFIEQKTGSNIAGVATGIAVGAALGAAGVLSGASWTPMLAGAMLGGFQTYRGNQAAAVRDAGSMGAMLAGGILHGPAKVSAGIAAAVSVKLGLANKLAGAAVAGVVGLGLGAGLAAVGYTPVSLAASAAMCGVAGAVGSLVGPRYSQFFRNMAKDFGSLAAGGFEKIGLKGAAPADPRLRNCLGALPASMVKEGFKNFIYSDGNLVAAGVGAAVKALQQMDIFLHAKGTAKVAGDPQEATDPPSSKP